MSNSASQILAVLGPNCRDDTRRQLLRAQGALNGIDFVEFDGTGGVFVLHVHFLLPLPAGAYGLPADSSPLLVHGGTRITGIRVLGAAPNAADPLVLDVSVDQQGDYAPYLLSIGWTRDQYGRQRFAFPGIDRLFSVAPVNFRPGCLVDFDCAPSHVCSREPLDEPLIDYLARDYASLRQLLFDYVAQHNPRWLERSPADIGTVLLELLAYAGDELSYFQDAVANEAYLDTARQRISVKRHAKLIDYTMHDGRNAWTFVHFRANGIVTLHPGMQLLTKIGVPMRFDRDPALPAPAQPLLPPGAVLHEITDLDYSTDPALAPVRVFEIAASQQIDPLNNELRIHAWGNDECCLARGATSAHVFAVDANDRAVPAPLKADDYLLLEEVRGPVTGAQADADPAHRQVVRIVSVDASARDGLFLAALAPVTHALQPVTVPVPAADTLPLTEVIWRDEDALTFPLCLTARLPDGTFAEDISLARGNIVLADHGRSVRESFTFRPPLSGDAGFRVRLSEGPLTQQCQPAPAAGTFPPQQERTELDLDVQGARPAVALQASGGGAPAVQWSPAPDLLSSHEFSRNFVADVDNEGRAVLRFGDGEYGSELTDVDTIDVWYRIGNGRDGNIGGDALSHIVVLKADAALEPAIAGLRNPVPAQAGTDPEQIEHVRQHASAAFRATQLRAVTEADYRDAALGLKGVAGAVASFRWTGSWYTVFVGIDPVDQDEVSTDARGITRLSDEFRQKIETGLERYRLAGYDLEIRSARYVPLDIEIHLCVKPGYFAADVAHAVAQALSAGIGRDGAPAFFNAANFSFGQPVWLSRIYAAVDDVDGVDSAAVTVFRRHGALPAGELENGVIEMGAWEIARLDNDPSNMENGTLTLTAGGGS
ncbi:hypothetical protein [Paraburkholderia sp. BR14320]|uniref:hypothetical protein n=1 Tax=unclassified Paraburkholderia TaxID=2615204 RepID=UPI0034CF8A0B